MFLNKNYVKTYNEENINNFNEDRVIITFFLTFYFFSPSLLVTTSPLSMPLRG